MGVMNGYLDVAQATMGQQSIAPPEEYIELWWYSGATVSCTATTPQLLEKGVNGYVASTSTASSVKLHTLNSAWNPNNKYAFEATVSNQATSVYAELWDITAGSAVPSSQISVLSNTATVTRSGQFTLTPGHTYGVAFYTANSGYTSYITDASLIVFPS